MTTSWWSLPRYSATSLAYFKIDGVLRTYRWQNVRMGSFQCFCWPPRTPGRNPGRQRGGSPPWRRPPGAFSMPAASFSRMLRQMVSRLVVTDLPHLGDVPVAGEFRRPCSSALAGTGESFRTGPPGFWARWRRGWPPPCHLPVVQGPNADGVPGGNKSPRPGRRRAPGRTPRPASGTYSRRTSRYERQQDLAVGAALERVSLSLPAGPSWTYQSRRSPRCTPHSCRPAQRAAYPGGAAP